MIFEYFLKRHECVKISFSVLPEFDTLDKRQKKTSRFREAFLSIEAIYQ